MTPASGFVKALLTAAILCCASTATASASCIQGSWDHTPDCPGHRGGSQNEPLPYLSSDQDHAYVAGRLATDHCHQVAGWAHVHHETRHGIRFAYYFVWATVEHSYRTRVALVCGTLDELYGNSTGPGAHGASLPCPHHSASHPKTVGWYVADHNAHYWQVYGGFGHHEDGFWHYKLHKATHGTTRVRLMGYCA